MVIGILVKHLIKRSKEQTVNNFKMIKLMLNITGICCLLGLTWIFGALTITKSDQAFQIIFTVANSLQGFFIFIFFCVLNGDVRSKTLPCKRHTTKMTCNTKESAKSQHSSLRSTLPSCSFTDNSKQLEWSAHVEEQVELTCNIMGELKADEISR